ncbi:MAG TPA: hypothetical protein ENL20_07450 [Candidatus Cloacimonetes bacterium]|nr:hypothetical protein [Candidatus Cloacimonadota bacterium]
MRSRFKFVDLENQLYFMTFTVVANIPVFTSSGYMDIIIENFKFYRDNENLKIFYYVIMDNHIHLVGSHHDNIARIIQSLKKYTAKEILKLLETDSRQWILYLLKYFKKKYKKESTYQFWQEGSHPEMIFNLKILNQKANYIHQNPVKRGLVEEEQDWLYSSARNIHGLSNIFEVDQIEF